MGFMLWIAVGIGLAAISRWVMPGPDPLGTLGTVLLGASAGLLGGVLGTLAVGGATWTGVDPRSLLLAIIAALVVLAGYRSFALRWSA